MTMKRRGRSTAIPILLTAWLLCPQLLHAAAGVADVAGEDPGLFLVMLFMLAAFVIAFLILGVLALGVLVVVAASLALGIVSAAALAGIYHRSVNTGFRIFNYLLFCTAGAGGGALAGWLLQYSRLVPLSWSTSVGLGAAAGIGCGCLGAAVWLRLLKTLSRVVLRKSNP